MKRIASLCLLTIFCLGGWCLLAIAQTDQDPPLAPYAREQKKNHKPAAHTFDNDNLPTEDKFNIVGKSAPDTAQAQGAPDSTADQAAEGVTAGKPPAEGKHPIQVEKMPQVSAGESEQDREQVYAKWQDKLGDQQQKLDLAARELDVAQREYKLRAAEMYGDAGNRLRNSADWDKKDADYKKQIEERQQALDAAKADMENMQEDARKAGVPSSVTEKAVSEKPQE